MYDRFGLTLVVTHECNLRCSYCYAGAKCGSPMSREVACKAIDRAIASLSPGGCLELGLFGGEPLLEARRIPGLIEYARTQTRRVGMDLTLDVTTNGTITTAAAWSIMMRPDVNLAVSCDGLPEIHDRHRRTARGGGTAGSVLASIRRLVAAGKDFHVVMVVRPDTMEWLPEGIEFLERLGVRSIEPSLDLWARWNGNDAGHLEKVITRCARLWRRGLPHHSIGWFDEKAAHIARVPIPPTSRCRFGYGQVAVAPSGRLYPCERLVGVDSQDNPMALASRVWEGEDFLELPEAPSRSSPSCAECRIQNMCNTTCRCGNYVRTGDVTAPDGLLCAWNRACVTETAAMLTDARSPDPSNPTFSGEQP